MKHGKKYIESAKSFDNQKLYDPEEGISVVLSTAKAKFDETIEAHIRLGVDSRHADQQVRGAVVLPHGTGKVVRVLVFAKGDKAREAQEAGADFVGDEDMVKKIQTENWFGFDVCVATPDMMGVVGRIGRVLGPKGLMPNPKSGTVTTALRSDIWGNYVVINHGDGFSSLYAHMQGLIVKAGDYVKQGQTIGYVGSTGLSTGPHLHFTIYYNGADVNPMSYIG